MLAVYENKKINIYYINIIIVYFYYISLNIFEIKITKALNSCNFVFTKKNSKYVVRNKLTKISNTCVKL